MHGDQVKDVILERMLNRVGARFDKREGSIIWDALAPAAMEFEIFFFALSAILDEVFADTATRKYLIKRAAERGITPKEASPAYVKGEFTPHTLEISIGERFSHEDLNYVVTEKLSDGFYLLECETEGSIANGQTGRLIPISYVTGLETAEIVEITIPGEDDEDTESLRSRYFASMQAEAYGGNKLDYKNKVMSISGVGGCKIYSGSNWNGGGTVLIVVQDSAMGSPSDEFIDVIQTEIDPVTNSGEGEGIAPIGHFVTVVPVNEQYINIETNITVSQGSTWSNVKSKVFEAVKEYLYNLNKNWDNTENIVVRIAHIESAILDVPGVIDVQDTTINNKPINFTADKNSIVVRGTINGEQA